ncbi:MAG: tRNA (N6-threonylcarbamoyladenosine(37)-N6)-methyltransferase TrmO [Clostridia bacterium]|nr:tRNA (N6-threonylcarbamoyladenosine(37)-N6)-methyltransferase TrmO [Clostridia bacterium]
MDNERIISPIAYIRTDFPDKFGVPRQSGRVDSLAGEIVFLPEYSAPEAFRGIEEFSHLWLIFDFSLAHREGFSPTVRPPRLGGNTRVGVFASRSPFRPNSIGLSSVKLDGVEFRDGVAVLRVKGADLVDNTPIYDVKPYIPYSDSHPDALGSYSDIHADYSLDVVFPDDLLDIIPESKRRALTDTLSDDPRPSYQEDAEREYVMSFAGFDIGFRVKNKTLTVTSVKKL